VTNGRIGASATGDDALPAEIRGAIFPETDPEIVKRALAEVLPRLAEEEQYRRSLKIARLYWLRNDVLSFLFGRDVAVAPDGSLTTTTKLILSAIALILSIIPAVCVTRRRRMNRSRCSSS
jgi:hypothetical protein